MILAMRARALAVATSMGLLAAAGCNTPAPEAVESASVVTVKTAAATLGTITGTVQATGLVTPAPGAELVVIAPEAARIVEIPRGPGDQVRTGDVLVRFDIPGTAAEVQRQQAEVGRAQAALDAATAARNRARDLFERGVAARRDVEESTRAEAEAQAMLAQAGAALAAAQNIAARSVVRATFDGIIVKRLHNPGDLVEAAAGDQVLRVIDPRRLEVVASVPLADAPRVRAGAPARLTGLAPGTAPVALKTLSRPVAVDPGTATVPVRLAFTAPANLPAGAPVQVEIEAEHHTGVLLVPAAALLREAGETAVFVAKDQKARRHPVQVGLADGAQVEILAGLQPGDAVIVDGQAGLPDDSAIAIADSPATGPGSSADPPGGKDELK